ncbi:gliding motility lipoprotein GldH [Mucilaginibacter sp.]|uniref:gliding motility lipoprotein GldH n=1 Tax=Mucilaginibacter sp. TaxID=1882438 RepID=UPI0035BBD574
MRAVSCLLSGLVALLLFTAQGCTDPAAVLDHNTELPNHNWAYVNRIKYNVTITDETLPYNLYFNLRVTGSYRYSNIFILLHQVSGSKTAITRYEYKLANKDGEWLGSGSGNLYSFQLPLRTAYKFPKKGTYRFEIEQNMRDNPLHEVSDVGLRLEKVK